MTLSKGSKVVTVLAILAVALFSFMLYFRAALYNEFYIAPEDAYGLADILELYLGLGFVVLSALSGLVSVVLFVVGTRQSKLFAMGLVVLHGLLYVAYGPLHSLAVHYGTS